MKYTGKPTPVCPATAKKLLGKELPLVTRAEPGTLFRMKTWGVSRGSHGHHSGYKIARMVWRDGTTWYVPLEEAKAEEITSLLVRDFTKTHYEAIG